MKDRFYIPFSLKIGGIPLLVYMCKDENPLDKLYDRSDKASVTNHVKAVYRANKETLQHGMYHVLFMWNLDNQRMTDIWIHTTNNIASLSGPLQEVLIFKEFEQYKVEVASGDTLIVLAREEELRRKVSNMEKYVQRPRYIPDFPMDMQPWEEFFL